VIFKDPPLVAKVPEYRAKNQCNDYGDKESTSYVMNTPPIRQILLPQAYKALLPKRL
jgi:hypothetical protein